jgi:hypothetical protein
MVLAMPRPAAAQEIPSPTVPPLPTEIPSPSIDPLPTETPSASPSPSPLPSPSPSPLPSPSPSVGPQPTDSPPPPPGPGTIVVPGITPGTEPPTLVARREGGTAFVPTNTAQESPSTGPKPSPTPELTPEPTQSVTESSEPPGVAGSFRFPIPPREVIPLVLVGLALVVLLPILLWKAYRETHRPGSLLNRKRSYLEY